MIRRSLAIAMLCALVNTPSFAQTSASPPTFEVASIKPAKPGPGHIFEVSPSGSLTWQTSVGQAIRIAYKVRPPFDIYGAPGWVDSDEYIIVAKPPEGSPLINPKNLPQETEFLQRVQALLAERFHLAVHRENREMPVYALVVAKNGPKLKEADTTQTFRLRRSGQGAIVNDGGAKIGMLVSLLANNFDRPVIDETGLTGLYSFNLKWTPDAPAAAPGKPPSATADAAGPSLFTALQEQLGLRLEAKKKPVEVLVVDHVERPTEN